MDKNGSSLSTSRKEWQILLERDLVRKSPNIFIKCTSIKLKQILAITLTLRGSSVTFSYVSKGSNYCTILERISALSTWTFRSTATSSMAIHTLTYSSNSTRFINIFHRCSVKYLHGASQKPSFLTTRSNWILHHIQPGPRSLMGYIGHCDPSITWGVLPRK